MDRRNDVREFLASRRARITPQRAGLPAYAAVSGAFPGSGGRRSPCSPESASILNSRAADFYPDWEDAANTTVALLRTEAGRDPHDRALQDLIGELATRSEDFRTLWAAHNVRLHHTGVKNFHHPVVGDLDLPFEAMPLPADPGLTLTAFSAEPGTPAQDALNLPIHYQGTLPIVYSCDVTCPKCHSPMQTFNRQGIHIEQCAGCGGIFLDRGELEQIVMAEQRHYAAPPPYPGGYSDSPPPYQGHRDSPPPYNRGHAPHHGHYDDSPPPYGRKGRKRGFLEDLFD